MLLRGNVLLVLEVVNVAEVVVFGVTAEQVAELGEGNGLRLLPVIELLEEEVDVAHFDSVLVGLQDFNESELFNLVGTRFREHLEELEQVRFEGAKPFA